MIDLIGLSFTILDFLLIVIVILTRRLHPLVSLHALLFWAFIVALNTIQAWIDAVGYYDDAIYLLVHTLLLTYLAVFLLLGTVLFKVSDTKPFLDAIATAPTLTLALCLSFWLVFRLYLLFTYGLASFNLLAVRELIEASYIDIAVNGLLWHAALGSFLVMVVKAVLDWRTLWNIWLIMPSSAFFIFAVVFNELGSARRFLLLLLFLVIPVLLGLQRRVLPQPRTIVIAALCAIMILCMAEYFQQIRHNYEYIPEVIPLMNQGEFLEAATLYLTPTQEPDNDLATVDSIQSRLGPFQVLYLMTDRQVHKWTTTSGEVLKQSLINVMPSPLMQTKEYVNVDHVIAEAFGLEDTDLPTGILASLQSDLSFLGYLVAPVFMILLISLYGKAMTRTDSHILLIVFFSVAVLTASYLEEVPDAILTDARDVFTFIMFVSIIRVVVSLGPKILLRTRPQIQLV